MAASLHYLTVQDVLWINLQVTKKVQHFNYAKLEEATFYQYAYGESNSLLPQAARFVQGFLRLHPFNAGNEATALVGCLAFLRMNGMRLRESDNKIGDGFRALMEKSGSPVAFVEGAVEPDPDVHETIRADVRGAITEVLDALPETLAAFGASGREEVATAS